MKPVVAPIEPNTADPTQTDAVQEIANTLIDATSGFAVLTDRATGAMKPHADRLATLHTTHLTELHEIMRSHGQALDMSGTFFGQVQKAVVLLRDVIGDLDGDGLEALRDGEQTILSRYEDAIGTLTPDHPAAAALRSQRSELESAVAGLDAAIKDVA